MFVGCAAAPDVGAFGHPQRHLAGHFLRPEHKHMAQLRQIRQILGASSHTVISRRLEEEKGIRIRFTTGLVPDEYKDEIAKEEAEHGEFLHIPIKVRL